MQTQPSLRREADCREANLVLQSARTYLSAAEGSCLQRALAQPLDWAAVERTADSHSIMPLVAYVLNQYGCGLLSQEVRERLQQRWLLTARSNLVRLQEWCRILQALEAADISVISLKGPALALLAYQNIALREFVDLDLLIRLGDVQSAHDVLIREGYQLRSPLARDTDAALLRSRNRQLDFVNERQGTLIDLHWGALHEMFSFQLPVDQLFESARAEHREGISFLSLSPEHLLLYLCSHGTKHCWLNLQWLCDVACHMKTAQDLDWELCIHRAEAASCDLVLKHSLLLAHEVLGSDLPSSIRSYCDDATSRALADTAVTFLFREDGEPGYGEALRYHLAFTKSWREGIHLAFERVFVPEELDRQDVRLPQSLSFLYYTVRPVRFMLERLSNASRESLSGIQSAREPH